MADNLSETFLETAEKYPSRIAIQWKKDNNWVEISYEDLKNRVESLAAELSEKGIKACERIGIILENRPEWPIIFFATVLLGAIVVPINPEASSEEVKNILADSGCKLTFTKENLPHYEPLCGPYTPWKSLNKPVYIKTSKVCKDEVCKAVAGKPVSGRNIACILYTSGTTANPKGVMLSHRNLGSNCESLKSLNLITPNDRVVSILPLHHVYPLTVTMLLPLIYGGTVVYPGSMRGEDLLKAMQEVNPTVFVAVPQIFYSFHEKIKEAQKKIPLPLRFLIKGAIHRKFGRSMRLFVSGGAKLDEAVERALFKLDFKLIEGYGLTETSPVLTINPLKKPKIGSVGLPVPSVEIDIVNKDEKGIGEVIARGPNIMEGYYKRDDLTAGVIKDGRFHTGDLGYRDRDGYLFLTGRSKDVIVLSSGLNVYPEEIEEAYLKEVPAKEMCVFEVPAKKGMKESRVLWAVVVPDLAFFRKYGDVNLRHVIKERFDNVSRVMPAHKRLMGFSVTLEPFPRTLLGKVKRFAVKEIYTPKIIKEEYKPEKKELSEKDRVLLESYCGSRIIDYLKKQTKTETPITPGNSLELDLGIDSLGRIELASGIEKALGIKIDGEIIGKAFTVRDLILGLEPLLSGRFQPPRLIKEVYIETAEVGSATRTYGAPADYWKKMLDVPLEKEKRDKIDLNPGFGAWISGFLFTAFLWVIFKLCYSLKSEGRENFPEKGPYILYSNHTSYLDGLAIAAALPKFPRRELFFIGFKPYFDVPVIRSLVKIGRIIPLDFAAHLLEAMRSSYYVLRNKRSLCIFPEGFRTLDGDIKDFKAGFGILAKESGALLVPTLLKGTFEAWPRTAKFPRRHPIMVKFGKPFTAEEAEKRGLEMGAKDSYTAICLSSRQALLNLVA